MEKIDIAVAEGDGIGPEIMRATLSILEAASAPLNYHFVTIGEKVYSKGEKTGISPESWNTIRQSKAFLKAPITTPQGGGFKSLNVTIRAALGLFANVRPCIAYAPFVATKHPHMDVVIIRENEEDLYIGLEYQETEDVVEATKLISKKGSEKIIRYAFEYARSNNRKKVTCFVKDNILKMSDGLFHKIFKEVAVEYPDIEADHWIVDIGSAKLSDKPENFDVVVMPNLYGDIISDITAEIAGSVGLAGSANIGPHVSMFEAIHGSAPRRAGQDCANPSGLLLASCMMLDYLGLNEASSLIGNAWRKTLEEGIHTYDIFSENSKKKVGTQEFAKNVIERFGEEPAILSPVKAAKNSISLYTPQTPEEQQKLCTGVDIFISWRDSPSELVQTFKKLEPKYKLKLVASRGSVVFPDSFPETTLSDYFRCRLLFEKAEKPSKNLLEELLKALPQNLLVVRTQLLLEYEGTPGYVLSQDEQ